MLLLSLRLRNFRGIAEATLTPLHQGITGIAGNNGAGKTTFLDALVWATLNTLPEGATKNDIRRDKASVKDECSVSAIYYDNGQTIEIIRELVGKANTTKVTIFVDGREQTHTSSNVANQWIIDRFNLTPNSFLTAYVVRQKELDSLLTARAAERRSLIEKFFGIEKISEALTKARTAANAAQKVAKALPGTQEEVDEAQFRADNAYSFMLDLERKHEELSYDANSTSLNHESILEEVNAQNTIVQNLAALSARLKTNEHSIELAQERCSSLNALLDSAARRAQGGDEESYQALVTQRNDLQKVMSEANDRRDKYERNLATLQADVTSLNRRIENGEREVKRRYDALASVQKELENISEIEFIDYEEKILDQEKLSATSRQLVMSRNERIAKLAKSVDTLSHHLDDATCPTCQTHLEDPSGLIETLKSEISSLEEEKKDEENRLKSIQETTQQLRTARRLYDEKISEREEVLTRLERSQQDVDVADKQLVLLKEEVKSAQDQVDNHAESFDISVHEANIRECTTQLASVNVLLARQEEAREAAQEVKSHENSIASLMRKIEEYEFEASRMEEELLSVPQVSDEEVQQLKELLAGASVAHANAQKAVADVNVQLSAAKARYEALGEASQAVQDQLDAKNAALYDAECKTAIAEVIDEFRRNRISRIAPELAETATSLISTATDGFYTEVLIDDDFTPTLKRSTGDEVPLTWLSGGETSVVALALRVAIGDMISGNNNTGLLWLDEVLVSQDADRRAGMMSMIRSLGRQTILVTHTAGADDIVDSLVTIIKDDQNGSRIAA